MTLCDPSDWPSASGEMARLIREHDWAGTPLGELRSWPGPLRAVVDLVLACPLVSTVAVGPERRLLYNDAAARLYGDLHPGALGRPLEATWGASFAPVAPFYDRAFAGEALQVAEQPLDVSRAGGELFDAVLTPVRDAGGAVIAVHMMGFEVSGRARAEVALRDSQARFRALFEAVDDGIVVFERVPPDGSGLRDWRYVMENAHFRAMFGRPELTGRTVRQTFPAEHESWHDIYDRVAETGEPQRLVREGPSEGMVLEMFVTRLAPGPAGEPRLLATMRNVTERQRAQEALREREERQAFFLRLADTLRPLAAPVEITEAATRLLGEGLGASRAYYVEWPDGEDHGEVHRDFAAPGLPSLVGRYPIEAFRATFDRISHGRTWIVEDNATAPGIEEAERQYYEQVGVIAWVDVPLIKAGVPQAALCVVQDKPRRWTKTEVALIEEAAERTWAAIERARAEARLRASEERFRTIVETATDYAIFTTDAAGRIETWPKGAEKVFGWEEGEALGRSVDITFTPEDRLAGAPARERQDAREAGQAPDVRWHLREDGSRAFIEGMVRPLTGPDGAVTGFLKIGQDVTERRATEAALRESDARFRQFGDASADVLWIRDAETLAFEYVSPAFEEIYGHKIEAVLGGNHIRRWAELIVPEDRELAVDHIRRVREGEHVLQSFRILRSDGQVRWIRDTSFPLLDEAGRVERIAGIAHDATEEVELHDRLRVLVAELQHRSRNLVGVVQGVTERTLATSDTLEEFRTRIRSRLAALGRVNGLLSRLEQGDRITFGQLLRTELQAHGVTDGEGHGSQVSLRGPRGIRLRSATVQTFALALHELTTNALKHGALSRPEGRLEVTWSLAPGRRGDRRLQVDWRETGVPVADPDGAPADPEAPPRRQGYGRELIERALPYQLRAQISYGLTPEGVRCTIVVPISSTLDVAFSSQGGEDA